MIVIGNKLRCKPHGYYLLPITYYLLLITYYKLYKEDDSK